MDSQIFRLQAQLARRESLLNEAHEEIKDLRRQLEEYKQLEQGGLFRSLTQRRVDESRQALFAVFVTPKDN